MYLSRLDLRFFRSFNFNYERKAHSDAEGESWELINGAWFPFISVELDRKVTAVVGANESGKSHLVDAIEQALTGEGIDRRDFCRYSVLNSVETGERRAPDFALWLRAETKSEADALNGLGASASAGSTVRLVRLGEGRNLLIEESGEEHELDAEQLAKLQNLLPVPFRLRTDVAIPDGISFDVLLDREERGPDRRGRFAMVDLMRRVADAGADAATSLAPELAELLPASRPHEGDESEVRAAKLAYQLLFDVARIDHTAFSDLEQALREGEEGNANGLIEQMNRSIARHLNFNRWWRQDQDFQLRLDLREHDVAFVIRDRTGTDYSFGERSLGLMYFLSYFVQLRAHQPASGRTEILLMDEPDAYLSSTGQQDLLRVLEDFARPEQGGRRDQVVYVTHSPFLIDKNAAHRIRVLDKGSDEEGTRVVHDAANNRYEPLRSSIGAYVAETAFIGGENLVVEGVADQVLLTGITGLLHDRGVAPSQTLDLNETTIVPAGGAASVPYMVFLARGRDVIKPPCVALLDGDKAGRDAAQQLRRSTVGSRKRLLEEEFIIEFKGWAVNADLTLGDGVVPTDLEDLIPLPVATEAGRRYARRFLGLTEDDAKALKPASLQQQLENADGRVWKSLAAAFASAFPDAHIDKIGFAKELVAYLEETRRNSQRPPGVKALEDNFGALSAFLNSRLAAAKRAEDEERAKRRTTQIVRSFIRDYPDGTTRDNGAVTLRELEAGLEGTPGDEEVRRRIAALRTEFKLGTDPLDPIPEFVSFCEQLKGLPTLHRIGYQRAFGRTTSGS